MGAAGIKEASQISRSHIYRRVFMNQVTTFEDIFPSIEKGSFLEDEIPDRYKNDFARANAESWCII